MTIESTEKQNTTAPAITYSTCYAQPLIRLCHGDNTDVMRDLEDESVDVILPDPPYLYLKNQKLEREFDEQLFFSECKRVLTKNGFIVMFGRGVSFYRWNTILADLGFTFKEEIIWNKSHCTSPLMALSRVHETVSIFTKGKGTINKVKVPYLEMKSHDLDSVIGDVKRMRSILKNPKSLQAVQSFLENNVRDESDSWNKNMLSISSNITKEQREVSVARSFKDGLNEKSIIRTDYFEPNNPRKGITAEPLKPTGDRCVNVAQSICFGLNEKSIIKQVRDHYTAIHPTQKPIMLYDWILKNYAEPNQKILDTHFGSGSIALAVDKANRLDKMNLHLTACEIDKEYIDKAIKRISESIKQGTLSF